MDSRRYENPREESFKPEAQLLEVPESPRIEEINVNKYLSELPENQFLVYSFSSLNRLGIDGSRLSSRAISSREISILLSDLKKVVIPETCDEITVFGGGKSIDVGKYLAFLNNKKINIIPALLSTNAFGTPFGCYQELDHDKTKITLRVGYPGKVLVDFAYLEALDKRNLYGTADVLSISTALHDWNLAIKKDSAVADQSTYETAQNILESCFSCLDAERTNIRSLFNLIANSAYITGLYGSGRPESGSEHIFSKYMEVDASQRKAPIMHGESVGVGIALMSTLQNNKDRQHLIGTIRNLGLLSKFENRKEELKDLTTQILTQLEPHPIRYTIVNDRLNDLKNPGFSADLAHTVIEELYS